MIWSGADVRALSTRDQARRRRRSLKRSERKQTMKMRIWNHKLMEMLLLQNPSAPL